ncbi:CD209 antigen-like protein C [Mytilus californianus]|uniref:CD209 antigen-like protein C n=1 Tax=Mytilus californianus TaxID=6549 RepID=UPI0022470AF4|nr:CD209 antigen-like protein C [Mytilus californianus]
MCQTVSRGNSVCIKDYKSSYCEDDWLYFGGFCYNFRNIQKSWQSAQEDCKDRNSNLIKVENEVENSWIVSTFLTAQTIDILWIGASDILNEGQWLWVSDGSNLTFSLWNDYEPNNSGTGEDCSVVKQTGMGWNDIPCDHTEQYLCKKKSR